MYLCVIKKKVINNYNTYTHIYIVFKFYIYHLYIKIIYNFVGSWFIQEFCNILQNGKDKITFLQAVSKTIDAVGEKKGVLNGINSVAQLPEIKSYRLSSDFQFPEYQAQV